MEHVPAKRWARAAAVVQIRQALVGDATDPRWVRGPDRVNREVRLLGVASGDRETGGPEAALLAALAQLRVHDASPVIEPGMPMFVVYDGPVIAPLLSHEEIGVSANVVTMAEHTGTHVDAPFHFDPAGPTIDRVAADALLLRPYKKFDLGSEDPQPGTLLGVQALRRAAARSGFELAAGDVAIIEMGWDRHWPTEPGDHTRSFWGSNMPGLDEAACAYLVDAGVTAVASDTAACDNAVLDGAIGDRPASPASCASCSAASSLRWLAGSERW